MAAVSSLGVNHIYHLKVDDRSGRTCSSKEILVHLKTWTQIIHKDEDAVSKIIVLRTIWWVQSPIATVAKWFLFPSRSQVLEKFSKPLTAVKASLTDLPQTHRLIEPFLGVSPLPITTTSMFKRDWCVCVSPVSSKSGAFGDTKTKSHTSATTKFEANTRRQRIVRDFATRRGRIWKWRRGRRAERWVPEGRDCHKRCQPTVQGVQ